MSLVFLAVVVVVVFAVAAAAAGRGDGLELVPPDLRGPRLPPDRVEPGDLDDLTLAVGLRGYRMDQVDAVLDRLRDELVRRDARIARLERVVRGAAGPAAEPGGGPAGEGPGHAG